jgi:hypothetical protein
MKRYLLTAMLAGAFSVWAFGQGMPLPPGIAAETKVDVRATASMHK